MTLSRRSFLAAGAAAALAGSQALADHHKGGEKKDAKKSMRAVDGKPFGISLAQWSLHRTIRKGEIDPIDFPKVAREMFDIGGVEYVNQFFADKALDKSYLGELKKRGEDHNVEHVLIMVDREGNLGDPDTAKRLQAVKNHVKWLDAAKFLGCHAIRVNAASSGSWEQQRDHAADGLRRLCEEAEQFDLSVLVENHGGLSSNGEWLSSVMTYVDHPLVGTLPDFGNFWIKRPRENQVGEKFDNYVGTDLLMDHAKAVSAKTYAFTASGNEATLDYDRLMKIVLDHGYHGWVGIEWEGGDPGEIEGIKLTKALLERIQKDMA